MNKFQRTTVFVLLFLCASSVWAAETPSEKADALLAGLIKTNDPGLAVVVAQNGKILFEKCYGLADREHGVPVGPETTFRIGSITKQFIAAAILKLQEQGKLSVKDKLSKYMPDFPRGNEVTLRQLLTHTSGIHDYLQDADNLSRAAGATTTEAIIEEIKKAPYDFDPGAEWRYDNSGYRLLGYIVEKVSGQRYVDFLHDHFFQPLGMTNTGICRTDPALPHEALGYSLGTNGFGRAPNWDISWVGSAGGLYSTAYDLYRWNESVFNGQVLDTASLKAALTPIKTKENQTCYNPKGDGYGFGWFVGHDRGLRYISHGGGLPGFSGMLVRLPDEKFTVAILANAMPSQPGAEPQALAHQLVDIYLADRLAPLPIVNTSISPESYDALTGRYGPTGMGGVLIISRRGAHLFVQLEDQPGAELFPKSSTEFFCQGVNASCTFVKDGRGKAVKLIFNYDSMAFVAPRTKDSSE